jgi:hypothetical protein
MTHLWSAAYATFILFCYLGASLFGLWLFAVVVSVYSMARRPKRNYRVGSDVQ